MRKEEGGQTGSGRGFVVKEITLSLANAPAPTLSAPTPDCLVLWVVVVAASLMLSPVSLLRIAPGSSRLLRLLVDRPMWQREPLAHLFEDHAHARTNPHLFYHLRRGKLPISGQQIARHAQGFVF